MSALADAAKLTSSPITTDWAAPASTLGATAVSLLELLETDELDSEALLSLELLCTELELDELDSDELLCSELELEELLDEIDELDSDALLSLELLCSELELDELVETDELDSELLLSLELLCSELIDELMVLELSEDTVTELVLEFWPFFEDTAEELAFSLLLVLAELLDSVTELLDSLTDELSLD